MKALILQHLTHRGTVRAAGFLFSARILSPPEMRRRIFGVWQQGAKIYRFREDLIMIFPESVSIDCRRAPALPLVAYGPVYASFPLEKTDADELKESEPALLLSIEGALEKVLLTDLEIELPERWLDTASFHAVEAATLGEIRLTPVIVERSAALDLRGELKNVPGESEKLSEILEVLRRKKAEMDAAKDRSMVFGGQSSADPSANSSSNFSGGADFSSLTNVFGSLFDSFRNLLSNKSGGENSGSGSGGSGKGGQSGLVPLGEPPPQSPGALRKLFTKTLFQMKIAQLIGRQQAKYLAEMMEMFERGDIEQALKHAIPLEDMQEIKRISEQLPFLGFLRPRDHLQINYGRQGSSNSSVHLENQWFDELRVLYRQTFDRLVAQNRFEEAAFVLAELLKSNHEAVEFLEKHGKFKLAAELAEARGLSKEIIVRQWFLAGEKRRAVQLAMLYNCFEYVVTKFEQENHPQAAVLREIWAESLAASGNYAAAVDVIWKLENRRAELAEVWLDRGIRFGGTIAAALLAKKISLFPETFADSKSALTKLLNENGREAREKRAAFANKALRLPANAELRRFSRALARRLLADAAAAGNAYVTPANLRELIEISGDYTLRTDLPKLDKADAKKNPPESFSIHLTKHDRGAAQIFDAHLLPGGKIALALGEAGVKIVSEKGNTIAYFDHPAEKLVVSEAGTKAICLARRGAVYRLTRIDFQTKRGAYWCDAAIDNYAATFDGNFWFTAEKDNVYAIDANAAEFEAVWRVAELGGKVYQIARAKNRLMLLTFNEKGFEKWWYETPSFTLRSRNQTKWFEAIDQKQSVISAGSFVAYSVVQIAETMSEPDAPPPINERAAAPHFQTLVFDYDTRIAALDYPDEVLRVGKPQIVERTYALFHETETRAVVRLYEIPQNLIAEFTLDDVADCHFRLDEKFLTITDAAGRVLVFDHKERILRRNFRG